MTSAEYLTFLNDLVAGGRDAEAVAACPRWKLGLAENAADRLMYARDASGLFVPARDEELGRAWEQDWPVVLIDWNAAMAYAKWLTLRTGEPWRLPHEMEREKAARGADARVCPWGNRLDATFACTLDSHADAPTRVGISQYPADESPYGVRGLAGNTRDWCIDVWTRDGPTGRRLRVEPARPEDPEFRVVKGGAWSSPLGHSRAATRFGCRPDQWRVTTGVRLVRA